MALSKEAIDILNNLNGVAQTIGLGNQIADAIGNGTAEQKSEYQPHAKIPHREKLSGSVTIASLKAEYNSLLDVLIEAGIMEAK